VSETAEVLPVAEQITEIMDTFDFGKVAKVMEFVGWQWSARPNDPFDPQFYTPAESDLRRSSREKLEAVAAHDGNVSVSSGGFTATKEGGRLFLEFVLEERNGNPNG
jgi:hypothetical protein